MGCGELFSLTPLLPCDRTGFLLAAGCAGWGGLSVLCQTSAILDGTDLPLAPCLLGKLTHGLLSALLAAPSSPFGCSDIFQQVSRAKRGKTGRGLRKPARRLALGEVMYEKIYQHAACLRRDRWSAGLGLLPGGQWAVGVYLKEWLFLSDQRRGRETALSPARCTQYTPQI